MKFLIISYVVDSKSKGKKNVLVLSTLPPIHGLTNRRFKLSNSITLPKILLHVMMIRKKAETLFLSGCTDIVVQISPSTNSRKWTRKHLCWILDIALTNSPTIVSLNRILDPRKTNSKNFGRDMAMDLVSPHILRRKITGCMEKKLTK